MTPWLLAPLLLVAQPDIVVEPPTGNEPGVEMPLQAPPQPTQSRCFSDFTVLKNALAEKYHEEPTSVGLNAQGQMLVVFASPGGDTFTESVTAPEGRTCVVATGTHWMNKPASGTPM